MSQSAQPIAAPPPLSATAHLGGAICATAVALPLLAWLWRLARVPVDTGSGLWLGLGLLLWGGVPPLLVEYLIARRVPGSQVDTEQQWLENTRLSSVRMGYAYLLPVLMVLGHPSLGEPLESMRLGLGLLWAARLFHLALVALATPETSGVELRLRAADYFWLGLAYCLPVRMLLPIPTELSAELLPFLRQVALLLLDAANPALTLALIAYAQLHLFRSEVGTRVAFFVAVTCPAILIYWAPSRIPIAVALLPLLLLDPDHEPRSRTRWYGAAVLILAQFWCYGGIWPLLVALGTAVLARFLAWERWSLQLGVLLLASQVGADLVLSEFNLLPGFSWPSSGGRTLWASFQGLLLDRHTGLLWYAPLAVMGLLAWGRRLSREHWDVRHHLFCGVVFSLLIWEHPRVPVFWGWTPIAMSQVLLPLLFVFVPDVLRKTREPFSVTVTGALWALSGLLSLSLFIIGIGPERAPLTLAGAVERVTGGFAPGFTAVLPLIWPEEQALPLASVGWFLVWGALLAVVNYRTRQANDLFWDRYFAPHAPHIALLSGILATGFLGVAVLLGARVRPVDFGLRHPHQKPELPALGTVHLNGPVSHLLLYSNSANSAHLEQGTPVAEIILTDNAGTSLTLPVRVGIETAEWAWSRADVRPYVRHAQPEVAYLLQEVDSALRRKEAMPVYRARLALPHPMYLETVRVQPLPERSLTLYDLKTEQPPWVRLLPSPPPPAQYIALALSAQQPEVRAPLTREGSFSGLVLATKTANSAALKRQQVGTVQVLAGDKVVGEEDIVLGRNTGEWAARRPDVVRALRHGPPAPLFRSIDQPSGNPEHLGLLYPLRLRFDAPASADTLVLRLEPNIAENHPDVMLFVESYQVLP